MCKIVKYTANSIPIIAINGIRQFLGVITRHADVQIIIPRNKSTMTDSAKQRPKHKPVLDTKLLAKFRKIKQQLAVTPLQ